MSLSRNAQLLMTELVLGYGTVCHRTLSRPTQSQFRRQLKTFMFKQSYLFCAFVVTNAFICGPSRFFT